VKRWLAFAPLIVLVLLAVMFVGWTLKRDPHVIPAALVSKPVPAVTATPLAGGAPVPLNVAARGPVLINVFFSTCVPCRVEHPELLRLKAQGVRVVGVAWKEDPAKTRAYLEELGDPFATVLTDPDGAVGVELGVSGAPETYVVNARGVIVDKWASAITPEDADRLVRELKRGVRLSR
jgi:cytochrome c biogenesis protein CcmG/thiol:disulfide interchange protein DsbE